MYYTKVGTGTLYKGRHMYTIQR